MEFFNDDLNVFDLIKNNFRRYETDYIEEMSNTTFFRDHLAILFKKKIRLTEKNKTEHLSKSDSKNSMVLMVLDVF